MDARTIDAKQSRRTPAGMRVGKLAQSDYEAYVNGVRELIIETNPNLTEYQIGKLRSTRLLYGVGPSGARGVCYYNTWKGPDGETHDTVEVAAAAQESWIQLGGTVVHELGHVLAGHTAGHGKLWAEMAQSLGFVKRPAAAGQVYHLAMFPGRLRERMLRLAETIADGTPAFGGSGLSGWLGKLGIGGVTPRPCSAGVGSRGGKSRGAGSGSRLRKYKCTHGQILRAATDTLTAQCLTCDTPFVLA